MNTKPLHLLLGALAAITLPRLSAADDLAFSGSVFFDESYVQPPGKDSDPQWKFSVTRTYLDWVRPVGEQFAIRVTTDAIKTSSDPRQTLLLKHAYLDWTTPLGTVEIGLQPTNYFGPLDATWGLRYIEKTPGDRMAWDPTADYGVSFKRTLGARGFLHASLYNGPGFSKAEENIHKRASLLVSFGEQRLNKNPGLNYGLLISQEPYDVGGDTETRLQLRVLGGAGFGRGRVGGEYGWRSDSAISDGAETLLGLYSHLRLSPPCGLVIRADVHDPSTSAQEDEMLYAIVGATYDPSPNVSVAPTVRAGAMKGTGPTLQAAIHFQFKF